MPCTNMKIIDNFLDKDEFEFIYNTTLLNRNFLWNFNDHKVDEGDGVIQFAHALWREEEGATPFAKTLLPIFTKKLNIYVWIRCKINLTLGVNRPVLTSYHKDVSKKLPSKTSIFYLTSTDGPTVFEGGQTVECVANRLVEFDSDISHAAYLHSDTSTPRVVINLNYITFN